jgi:hypothetical protein
MKYRAFATWLIETDDYEDVDPTGPSARALAQAQINREADLPDSIQLVVSEADDPREPLDDVTIMLMLARSAGNWLDPEYNR